MPSWGELLEQITAMAAANDGQVNLDAVRQQHLMRVNAITGRSVVHYTTNFMGPVVPPGVHIHLGDKHGLMEVFRGLPGPDLDLILHSPGGQAEATDSLVKYMRTKFTHVRVFIPFAAMSAATMWSMAADEIVMGKHSQVGPIDPQITLNGVSIPAKALVEQFEEASDVLAANPEKMGAWVPTLQQYPPGLLNICKTADQLGQRLVADWLKSYMLKDHPDRDAKADAVAQWLSGDSHLSHSRAIDREQLREFGLQVTDLEEDNDLQDAVLSVHHAAQLTFGGTPAVKIVENHLGSRWVQQGGMVNQQVQQ